jgi:hypothetical protein
MRNDNAKDLITIELTKEQWEEVYQWYIIAKDECRMEEFEIEVGEKIAKTLKDKYGTFK